MLSYSKFLVLIVLPFMALASYNTTTCTVNCARADTQFANCNWDADPYGGYTSCICDYGGDIEAPLSWLDGCVVCEESGLGQQNLATYQEWSWICGVYNKQGAAAASSVALNEPTQQLLVQFTTVLWSILESVEGGSLVSDVMTSTVSSTMILTASPVCTSLSGMPTTFYTTSASSEAMSTVASTSTARGNEASPQSLWTRSGLMCILSGIIFILIIVLL